MKLRQGYLAHYAPPGSTSLNAKTHERTATCLDITTVIPISLLEEVELPLLPSFQGYPLKVAVDGGRLCTATFEQNAL